MGFWRLPLSMWKTHSSTALFHPLGGFKAFRDPLRTISLTRKKTSLVQVSLNSLNIRLLVIIGILTTKAMRLLCTAIQKLLYLPGDISGQYYTAAF